MNTEHTPDAMENDADPFSEMPEASPEPVKKNPQALGKFLIDDDDMDWEELVAATSSTGSSETDIKEPGTFVRNIRALKTESIQQRVVRASKAETPLLEAAQPLLRVLSELPDDIHDLTHVEILKNTLKSEIQLFDMVCDEINVPWKKMAIVRYCLCTALDEAAIAAPWGVKSGWSQSNLLNHFEGDNDGGNKFFLLVGRLSMNPHEFVDVLEVMLRILGLGFEGRYSIIEDGVRQLDKIRQRLLTIIQSTRNTTDPKLSPQGLLYHNIRQRERLIVPVRLAAMVGVMIVASTFIFCKYRLASHALRINFDMNAVQSLEVTIPQPKLRLRLAVLLRKEIQQRLLTVDETQKDSKVVLTGDSLFASGSTTVKADMDEVIKRIAHEVQRVNGHLVIVGHSDSTPIHRNGIANNTVLSKLRADDVAKIFIAAGLSPEQIQVEGVGDTQLLASNHTVEGRARNRRVEFFVTYQRD